MGTEVSGYRVPRRVVVALLALAVGALGVGTAGAVTRDAKPREGPPIRIMTINPLSGTTEFFPYWVPEAMQAAAKAINKKGIRTLDGLVHQLHISSCDDQFTPTGGADSARRAISEGVVAVVGNASGMGDSYVPVLAAAGIPIIGTKPISAAELTNKMVFPVQGGLPVNINAFAHLAKAVGCQKPKALTAPSAQLQAQTFFLSQGVEKAGLRGSLITVPQNPNYPQLAQSVVADGGDCVALVVSVKDALELIPAIASTGKNVKVFASMYPISPDQVAQLGAYADNLYLVSSTEELGVNPKAQVTKQIQKEMEAFKPKGGWELAGDMFSAWAVTHILAEQIIPRVPTLDAKALAAFLPTAGTINFPGIAPFSWATPDPAYSLPTNPPTQFRVFNPKVYTYRVQSKKLVPLYRGLPHAPAEFATSGPPG